jgi:Cytochrome P460
MFARGISRRFRIVLSVAIGIVISEIASLAVSAPPTPAPEAPSPSYARDGNLIRPLDYREWVYVTSGLGMTYGPAKATDNASPRFDNVFVTQPAYREFLKSGKWPDRTMFILEVRKAEVNVSINNGGRTQGDVIAIEAAVKDRTRYADDGWAYFSFDGPKQLADSAAPLPVSASCTTCHRAHAAVDNTFVQFYPTLFDVAKRLGTVKPTYDPTRKP